MYVTSRRNVIAIHCDSHYVFRNKQFVYSRARLIRTANVRKNHVNYASMRIIRAYFTLHSYEWQRVVSRASMRMKWGMRISEGQIIRAILGLADHIGVLQTPIQLLPIHPDY